MGMTYEQFWDGPPAIAVAYRKAYRLKRECDNEQAWLQGLYVFNAFAVCLANTFAKRGAKKHTYLERPIDIFPISEAEKQRREQEEWKKMDAALQAIRKQQMAKQKPKQGD